MPNTTHKSAIEFATASRRKMPRWLKEVFAERRAEAEKIPDERKRRLVLLDVDADEGQIELAILGEQQHVS
jgi:hypothetical protein